MAVHERNIHLFLMRENGGVGRPEIFGTRTGILRPPSCFGQQESLRMFCCSSEIAPFPAPHAEIGRNKIDPLNLNYTY